MLRQWAFTRPRARQLVVFRRVAPPAAAGADPGGRRRRLSCAGRPCALPGGGSPAGRAAPRAAVGRARPATRRAPPPPLPILPLSSPWVADSDEKYKIVSKETGKTGKPAVPLRERIADAPGLAAPPGAPPAGTGCGARGGWAARLCRRLCPQAARHSAGAEAAQRSAGAGGARPSGSERHGCQALNEVLLDRRRSSEPGREGPGVVGLRWESAGCARRQAVSLAGELRPIATA